MLLKKLGRWTQPLLDDYTALGSRLEHLSLFTFVSQMMGGCGSGGRAARGAGGQRFVFWTMVLCLWARCRTPDYFQCGISSVLTDPSCVILSRGRNWTYLKILTNLIVNGHGFKTVLLVCWNKTGFSVTLSIYVAAACEDFTPCHGLTESLDSQSDWRQWGGDERRRLKGYKKSKRGEGGDFYSLSSMIDVRSIVEGKGRHEGAEKSIREGEA